MAPTNRTDERGVVEVFDVSTYKETHPDAEVVTCGACGRSWDDSVSTAWTPVPAGRCPFEYEHRSDAADAIIAEARAAGFEDSHAEGSRFESESDPILTAALWELTMFQGQDDEFGTTDDIGWHALIGAFIVRQDNAGWIESWEFESQ